MQKDTDQTANQSYEGKPIEVDNRQSVVQGYERKPEEASANVFDLSKYQAEIREKLKPVVPKFHDEPEGLGNLEYLIADDGEDLARDAVPSLLITPEERAYRYLNDFLIPLLFYPPAKNASKIFLKHTMQSRLGTHCVFGLQYSGFEIDEHSFVVHVDKSNRVVMVSCTYLPRLPELFGNLEFEEVPIDKVKAEIDTIREYDRADGERLWLAIWDKQLSEYRIAPGNQVKLSLPTRQPKKEKPPTGFLIPKTGDPQRIYNSPGLGDGNVGLGEIIRQFLENRTYSLSVLDDDHIKRYEGILQDLDSGADLIGKYASIKDEIDSYSRDKKGIFVNESESKFDRVTAYYHLDYVQRYFREKLGLHMLDNYPHLNPVQMLLSYRSDDVARYDVNGEKIVFYRLRGRNFTAVRDPRLVYHEFVHVVTDAIARLHRAGRLFTPRAKESLQAQAMDEGLADYFASSLAKQQGATSAVAYYVADGKWRIVRELEPKKKAKVGEPEGPQIEPIQVEPVKIADLSDTIRWNQKKYQLGELWGRSLWQLRKSIDADEITDALIAHSIFFLTRWATLKQAVQALLLTDRLLFSARHQEAIVKHMEVANKFTFI